MAPGDVAAQANAHNVRGIKLAEQGYFNEAAAEFESALRLQPADAHAHSNLGNIYFFCGNYDQAIGCYRQAVLLKPDLAEAYANLGNLLLLKGMVDEALIHCRKAISLKPGFSGAFINLGNALQEKSQFEEAVAAYRQALQFMPHSPVAHSNLGRLFTHLGDCEQAKVHFEHAVRLQPSSGLRITLGTLLPTLYQSNDELLAWRRHITANVCQLLAEGVRLDLNNEPAYPPFLLAYQGFNDSDLQRQITRLYVAPQSERASTFDPVGGRGKIKLGFVSKYFKDHTIGYWMRGLVAQLTRDVFEVTVISIGRNEDEIARFFREHADRYLEVPNHVPSARRLIADQKLDVLFYADIGMDHTSYSLAFSRLAPVQCVTWGHPVTTGIETVDYFVSCELMEIPEAQEHYTETLIQLKHPPIYYYRPAIAPPSKHRADFGLTKEDHVYICLQTASKFHPDFDELLGGILRGDPRGQLVLSQWLVPSWERHLRQRFAHTLSDVLDRIRFVPMMKYHDYLSLVAAADVQLDPIHFGGGNTSYDAFSVGTPIVTLPSKFLRGRFTLAMYKQMGFLDCVAGDRADYVKLALRLGTNPDFRDCMHNKILAASHVLFENGLGVRELERFLQEAVAKTRS